MHTPLYYSVSGGTDYYAADENEVFQTDRDLVETLNLPSHPGPTRNSEEPLFDPEQIQGHIQAQQQETMDIRKVLSRIVDGSRFSEFKVQYGTTLVTGFAHVQGYLVGIIGNNGEITDTAAAKGAHFVQMCSERNIPIVFLHNTVSQSTDNTFGLTGGNFVRDHAKMMAAVSCAKVPKISFVIGNSIGPSNFLMCGRSCSPILIFSWPNAAIGMMKGSQIVQAIMQEKFDRKDVDNTEAKAELEKKLTQKYLLETSAFYISSRVLDDGIILPQHTRQVIGRCLDITAAYLPRQQTNYPVIRM
ncbi:methylcrotonoyl-CoA carboxylase beta chain, mitochondrial-like [Ruditapes philippinarum]|uniref:methylcrotonoyl-CoA carboxylase beta chain, mitochondrial-like n=1 Tax=Ruditapes philippinarum TaxID=129788 RepID=UPI00295AF7EF|nr:methylcrotonoyl-CoA carboxylase beta chain, mitochondrial-like [Ruditapes philippinarum]